MNIERFTQSLCTQGFEEEECERMLACSKKLAATKPCTLESILDVVHYEASFFQIELDEYTLEELIDSKLK